MDVEQLITIMHRDLAGRVDAGFKDLSSKFQAHEIKDERRFGEIRSDVAPLQNMRKTMRWFIGVVVVALIGGVVEHMINHRTPDPVVTVLPAEKFVDPRVSTR